ncbi:hypothetical protein [Micromonospora sp. SH-82]|uniref:hypothetical protein n=1 Tax=Micromonospora sp. SH-82 TaxID=3132938 RepID=UPI003EBDE2B0
MGERRLSNRRRYAGRNRVAASISVGSLNAELEAVIDLIDRNHQHLVGVVDRLARNHLTLMGALAGGNPTLLRLVDGRVTGARRAIEEACTLLRGSRDQVRGYLRTI